MIVVHQPQLSQTDKQRVVSSNYSPIDQKVKTGVTIALLSGEKAQICAYLCNMSTARTITRNNGEAVKNV